MAQALTLFLLTVTLAAPGTEWVQTTSLPESYANQSLAYASGYLYQAGGYGGLNGITDGTNVFYAQVHSDGTIGTWKSATSLAAPLLYHAGVAGGGSVYVLGGWQFDLSDNYAYVTNAVQFANIKSDGSLGSWQTTSPLPVNLEFLSASVWNNRIYAIGGSDGTTLQNTVYSATIQSNGSLSAWATQPALPFAIYDHAAAANGFLYVLGGVIDKGSVIINSVYYSKINADGTLAGWNETEPLPQALCNFGVVSANGSVFSFGGWLGSEPTSASYGAAVNGDGSLGQWSAGVSLPLALQQFAVAASDTYIFLTGGLSTDANSGAVYSTALPTPPAAPQLVSRSFTNGIIQIRLVSSAINAGFGIQSSSDLRTWANVISGFTDTNGVLLFQDTNEAGLANQFYRAYWPLP
jgi:hypothetical protein